MNNITVERVQKFFGTDENQVHAISSISLEIGSGEFLCILGESGCGKSTLLRILAGIEKPTSGEVLIDAVPVEGPDYRRGIVFQKPALLPWLSVKKNIALGFKIRGQKVPDELIQDTIELVGIEGFDKTKPANLSGGMAQRAAIARALIGEPDILLMDEPFGALDALTRLRLQDELLKIWRKKQMTIVFITHDIDEAIALATRIVVMTPRPGKIGRILQVPLNHPRSRRSADFLRLQGVISDELINLLDSSKFIQTESSL